MKRKEEKGNIDGRDVLESLGGETAAAAENSGDGGGKPSAQEGKEDKEPSLVTVIKKQAIEEEQPLSKTFTLRKILGGEMLSAAILRKQIGVILLITGFIVLYISNRYNCQQCMIEIDTLERNLKDVKYRALSSSSTLTEMSRESRVLEILKSSGDSVLHISKQPPYIIEVPKE